MAEPNTADVPKTDAPKTPFKTPENDPTVVSGQEKQSIPGWTPELHPIDGSPVKTVVSPGPGVRPRARRPKTVAEHNAEVDKLAKEQFGQ